MAKPLKKSSLKGSRISLKGFNRARVLMGFSIQKIGQLSCCMVCGSSQLTHGGINTTRPIANVRALADGVSDALHTDRFISTRQKVAQKSQATRFALAQ
jgi:hypothetical protein